MIVNTAEQKQQMRLLMQQKRDSLSPAAQLAASIAIKNILSQLTFFSAAKHIGGYLAFASEVDLSPIFELAFSQKKQCYVPYLDPNSANKSMSFAPYSPTSNLHLNRLGIREPSLAANLSTELMQADNLDLMLIPLIAFDQAGNRLGMGGGYFDATLKNLPRLNNLSTRPKLIGIAHACQEVASVPRESWDVALDGIVTDTTFIIIN